MAQLINLLRIRNWLSESAGRDAIFVSIRFKTSPKSKDELCDRCKKVFRLTFRKLLRRHWFKTYERWFFFIGFQEYGFFADTQMHAHFIIGACESIRPNPKININALVDAMKSLSDEFGMDVWASDEDKAQNPKRYGGDIMIKRIYSDEVFSYAIKEVWFDGYKITNDTIITSACLFGR